MKLFISYSRDDKRIVYQMADELRIDHTIWIDKEQLTGGQVWWDEILKGIEGCDCFITVLSPRSIDSMYCSAETQYAQSLNKAILPLKLKNCVPPESLSNFQIVDIVDANLDKIIRYCERSLHRLEPHINANEFPMPDPRPKRPRVPTLKKDAPPSEHVYEQLAMAEVAFKRQAWPLAENLFKQVLAADPHGEPGKIAQERLAELVHALDCEQAYKGIMRFVEDGNLDMARRLWPEYVTRRGCADYDQRNVAALLIHREPQLGDTRTDDHGIEQVYVPPGEFLMGSDPNIDKQAYPDEQPQHPVRITRGFWLDMHPLTNAAYRAFIKAGGYTKDQGWSADGLKWRTENNITAPEDYKGFTDDLQPRVGVSWWEADAYARWRGARLLTEAEWEYAARGPKSLIYPWGNEYKLGYANIDESNIGGAHLKKTSPIGSYPQGKSWCGAHDMSGNVWEWVADYWPNKYISNKLEVDPFGQKTGSARVVRGGSWNDGSQYARAACRNFNLRSRSRGVGLRFALSVPIT